MLILESSCADSRSVKKSEEDVPVPPLVKSAALWGMLLLAIFLRKCSLNAPFIFPQKIHINTHYFFPKKMLIKCPFYFS